MNTNTVLTSQEGNCYCQKCAEKAEKFNQRMLDKEDLMFDLFDEIKASNILESRHVNRELETFSKGTTNRSSRISLDNAGRSFERAFSFGRIKELLNHKLTFPISHHFNKWAQENTMVFFTTVTVQVGGVKKQRPFHIVVGYSRQHNESTIVTAYYPDMGKNKHFWKDNYIERACFCRKNEWE